MKVKYRVYNYYGKVMAITTNKDKAIRLSKTLNGIVEAFKG